MLAEGCSNSTAAPPPQRALPIPLSQLCKRRKERAGKGDVQFGQTKRKGALIRFIFGIYTANLQDRQRR